MIRAVAYNHTTKRNILLVGLSFSNLDKLRAGPRDNFINISGRDTGDIPLDVIIFAGETESAMTDYMQEFISDKTKITISPKLKQ